MYTYDQRPGTRIADASQDVIKALRDAEYAVLVGRNNSGKSWLLKTLTMNWGQQCSYLGPARYQNFNVLGYYTPNSNTRWQRWNQFSNEWNQQQQNIDNSPLNLQQAIAELSDMQRAVLIEIIERLLNARLEIRYTAEGNSMSQKYISVNGHNISFTSSGFRLITTLVTSLLDTNYDTVLIDEPELGISPEAQGILADFLFDRAHRAQYFPHVKTLILATHSTIFLDRHRIANNYIVSKVGDEVSLSPVTTQSAFNGVHFFLLGNRLETLYLPSAIVIVEGKTDHRFIERVLALRYPNAQLSVIAAHSDSRVKEVVSMAKSILTDIQKSPYERRLFVVLDETHQAGLPQQLQSMGVRAENIVVWKKNGIEYYYPSELLDRVYGAGRDIVIKGDTVSRNGISYPKADLADKIITLLEPSTVMHPEFEAELLTRIGATVG